MGRVRLLALSSGLRLDLETLPLGWSRSGTRTGQWHALRLPLATMARHAHAGLFLELLA